MKFLKKLFGQDKKQDCIQVYNENLLKYKLGKYNEVADSKIIDCDNFLYAAYHYDLIKAAKYRLANKDNLALKTISQNAEIFKDLLKTKKYHEALSFYNDVKLSSEVDIKRDSVVAFFKAVMSCVTVYSPEHLCNSAVEDCTELSEIANLTLGCDEFSAFIQVYLYVMGGCSPEDCFNFLIKTNEEHPEYLIVYQLLLYVFECGLLSNESMQKYLTDAIDKGINYAYLIRCLLYSKCINANSKQTKEDFEKFKSSFDASDYAAIPLAELQIIQIYSNLAAQ